MSVFSGKLDATQAIPDAAPTRLVCDEKVIDTDGAYGDGAFTVPETGLYTVYALVNFRATGGWWHLSIFRNGRRVEQVVTGGATGTVSVRRILYLNQGDELSPNVYQSSGSSQTLDGEHASVFEVNSTTGDTASRGSSDLSSLEQQITQLQRVAATVEELAWNAYLPGTIRDGAWHTAIERSGEAPGTTVWVAPFPCTLVSAVMTADATDIDADEHDYARVELARIRHGDRTEIVAKDTSQEAMRPGEPWLFDGASWDQDAAGLRRGDGLAVRVSVHGGATFRYPCALSGRVIPAG